MHLKNLDPEMLKTSDNYAHPTPCKKDCEDLDTENIEYILILELTILQIVK